MLCNDIRIVSYFGGGRVLKGVMYLMSLGRLTDNLAYSWARFAILVAGKGRGGMFLFLLFLHFHSCFFPVPLFHLLYYFFYLFSPFLWEMTGVVGCGKGVVYLKSSGHPADNGLQLVKACCPCSR